MDKDREMETTERWIKTERWQPQRDVNQREMDKQRDGNHIEMDKDREMETKERWIKTETWKPQRDG